MKYTDCTSKTGFDKLQKMNYLLNMDRLTFAEQLKIILHRKDMTVADLAGLLGISRQGLNQKMIRDNFTYNDMIKTAAALGYDVKLELIEKS